MHGIIGKQGKTVTVAFCYICLFKNPVITILKDVGCENCVRENKLSLWGSEGEAPTRWAVLAFFFSEKNIHLTPFG